MISYDPLFKTLKEKGLIINYLREHGIHPTTVAKINRYEIVTIETIILICEILEVPIEKVVEIKFRR